jgi:hypothetical protein
MPALMPTKPGRKDEAAGRNRIEKMKRAGHPTQHLFRQGGKGGKISGSNKGNTERLVFIF